MIKIERGLRQSVHRDRKTGELVSKPSLTYDVMADGVHVGVQRVAPPGGHVNILGKVPDEVLEAIRAELGVATVSPSAVVQSDGTIKAASATRANWLPEADEPEGGPVDYDDDE